MDQPVYDLITIKGITAFGLHGVYPLERSNGQEFSVDLTMEVDIRQAAATDDLYYTVDYSQVALEVSKILQGTPVNLLESLAETIARKVLSYPLVAAVSVQVHKPQAPLNVKFDDLSLSIHRTQAWLAETPQVKKTEVDLAVAPAEPVVATVALGANLGDAPRTLAQAIVTIDRHPQLAVIAVSGLFKTAPMLMPDQAAQPDYYNAVIEVETTLSPLDLLAQLHQIEAEAGRVRKTRWEARLLDLDILDYAEIHCETPELTLPHPRAHERAFVLQPWKQINPQATVGRHGRVEVLVQQVLDQSVEQLAELWVEDALNGAFSKPASPKAEPEGFVLPDFMRTSSVPNYTPQTVARPEALELPQPTRYTSTGSEAPARFEETHEELEKPTPVAPLEAEPETELTVAPQTPAGGVSGIRRTYLDTPAAQTESPIFAELAGRRARMQTEWMLTKHQIDRDWEMRRFAIERELRETQERIEAARKRPAKPAEAATDPAQLPKPRLRDYQGQPATLASAEPTPTVPQAPEVRIFDEPTAAEPKEELAQPEPQIPSFADIFGEDYQTEAEEETPEQPQQPDFESLIRGLAPQTGDKPRKMPSWKKVVAPPEPRIVDDSQSKDAEATAHPQAAQSAGEEPAEATKLVDENGNFTSRLQRRQILRPAPTGATPVIPRAEEPQADDFGFAPWSVTPTDSATDPDKS
ncbi:MAG: 2-amino-4-hydroxy-6-hydroxymethyldihydropteridine diphosphokinase [Actinomycetaceae bacterium]|nr:2-amino-4-hydroxy-6-hydroxymethyldihydropteridine diphosphokinase [Actinomycetaceae bacterium]